MNQKVYKIIKEKDYYFAKNVIYCWNKEVRWIIAKNVKFVCKDMIIIACSIQNALQRETPFHSMPLLFFLSSIF